MNQHNDNGQLGQADSGAPGAPLYGLLAEYRSPEALVSAARLVRDSGFKHWDTFTPYPIHGIDPAMGIRPTILPWLVLGGGIIGCLTGLVMQWWMNAVDYPWLVSGKPFWSVPANIPIVFELTVLFSALTALGGMLVLNRLPHPSHPLDLNRRFARSTDDRFFLLIEARDPRYEEQTTKKLLGETEASSVEEVLESDRASDRVPRGLVYAVLITTVAAIVPFAYIAKARASKSRETRLHLIPDMDFQPKVKPQDRLSLFADQRAMRQPVSGTVAFGALQEDEHLNTARVDDDWAKTFPESLAMTKGLAERGKERFGIYCAPCHGLDGRGAGIIAQRADALAQGTWVPPTDLIQPYLAEQPVGQLFNTITHGIRNMPPYASQIPAADRWAVVLYLRALQRSGMATLEDVPPTERRLLQR